MAATLKLRSGTPSGSLQQSELFYDKDIETLVVGDGSGSNTTYKILSKLDEPNSGSFHVLGDITGSNILASNITATGDLTIGGNLFLGDNIADNIVISAELSSSLIPDVNDSFDLGSNSKKWRHIYATSASIDNITLNGSGIISGSEQLPAGLVSGSSQITITESQISDLSHTDISSLNSYTASNDTTNTTQNSRLDQLSTETGSITTEQGIQDSRLDQLSTETGSITSEQAIQDSRLDQLSTETGSITSEQAIQDQRLDAIEADSGSYLKTVDISTDTNLAVSDTTEVNMILTGDTLSAELIGGVISGSSQITITESQISDLSHTDISSINSFTSSIQTEVDGLSSVTSSYESRINLLSDVSHSHSNKANLDTINQDLATTSDITFNDADFTGDVQVNGSLTVLGSATEISTTELRIEDKLITVASGSADSAAADGAGIEIDGAGVSLQWDHNTTSFVLDAKVSSSVGFKGEGGELTGIDTDQVTEATNLYYTDTRVKTKLDVDDIHSGSYLGTATTTNLSEGSNLYYTDARVKIKLDTETVVSGSSQVIGILGSLNSYTSSNDLDISNIESTTSSIEDRLDNIEAVSSSYLTTVDISDDTNLAVSDTSEVNMILSGDTLSAELIGGVVSGSSQITITESQISDLSHYTDSDVKLKLDTEGVVSGSSFSSNHQGSITASINGTATNLDLGLNIDDSPTFSTLTLSSVASGSSSDLDALFDVSGLLKKRTLGTSALFNVSASISDDPNSIPTTKAVNDALVAAGAGDITAVNSTSTISPSTTGLIHTEEGTEDGGSYGNTGNIVIAIDTGSVHFTAGVDARIPASSGGLVSGSSQIDVTATTNYGSINQYSDSKVKLKLDADGVISGSSQIDHDTTTNFVANEHIDHSSISVGSGKGLSGGGTIDTNRSIFLDTGSAHFQEGVELYSSDLVLPAGTVSGSSQITITESQISDLSHTDISSINAYTASNDTTNTTQNSRLDLLSTETGSISTEQTAQDSRLDQLSSETGSYLTVVDISTDTNLAVADTTNVEMILTGDTLSANLTGNVVSGSSQVSYVGLSNIPSGIVSGSSQITITESQISDLSHTVISSLNSYTSSNDTTNSGQDTRLNQLAASTGSYLTTVDISTDTNLSVSDTSEVNMILSGDTLSAKLIGGVISGSSQVSLGGDVTGTADDVNVGSVQGVALTSGEATQIATIGTTTISATQWGYLGGSDQNVKTSSDVTFASASLSNVVISGNLTVLGDAVELGVSELTVEDKTITVASGSADSAAADGAGIIIAGADESITWNHANTRFNISDDIHVTGTIKATDDIIAYASSDIRLKNNILPITNPLEKINSIGGYSFDWNTKKQHIYNGKDYGVIAQEIEQVLPELVQTRENGYKAVKYDKLVSLLIEGIKELSNEVEELKRKIGNK